MEFWQYLMIFMFSLSLLTTAEKVMLARYKHKEEEKENGTP